MEDVQLDEPAHEPPSPLSAQASAAHAAAMDVEPVEVAPAQELARVVASAETAHPAQVDGEEEGRAEAGSGFLGGVKKSFWRLVGY